MPDRRLLQRADAVLQALYLIDVTAAVLEAAAAMDPRAPLTNAIHIATALSIDDPDLEVLAYDTRCIDAAGANGLRVVSPGR